jgi:flagellar assembly protein FliH
MEGSPILRDAVLGPVRRTLQGPRLPADLAPATSAAAADGPPSALEECARAAGHALGLKQGLAAAAARIDGEIAARQRQLESEYQRAAAELVAEHERRVALLDEMCKAFDRGTQEMLTKVEAHAVALAYEALCKILGPQPERRMVLADLVKAGLKRLEGQALHRVRMHPADIRELRSLFDARAVAAAAPIPWHADSALEPGSCLVEADRGLLDVSLSGQLERLRDLWTNSEVTR